jgi:hypothetical protein
MYSFPQTLKMRKEKKNLFCFHEVVFVSCIPNSLSELLKFFGALEVIIIL